MNISCLKENLKEHLDNALRIVKYNSTLPILNNFLLNTEKGVLKISSTDLEIGFTSWVPSKILKEGSITVPAQLLSQFINNLPNKTVEMEVKDNNKLYLSCDNIKAHINGLSADDFPIIPRIKNDSIMTVDSLILKEAIGSVINSAASSDSLPEISSILIKIEPDQLKFIATDSFRLAHKTINLSEKLKGKLKLNNFRPQNVILPLRTASEILRVLGNQNTEMAVSIDKNQVLFNFGNTHIISRLIEGSYPDYESIIPKSFETKCYVSKNSLEEAIKSAGCFSSKLNDISLKTNSGKSQIEIYSTHSEYGGHHAKIYSEIEGKDVNVVFNWHYILDGIKNIDDDDLVLELNGDQKPATIKSVKNSDFFYILMPIRNV